MGLTYVPLPQEGIEYLRLCPLELGIFARRGAFPKVPLAEIPFVTPTTPLPMNPLGIKERDGWPESLSRGRNVPREPPFDGARPRPRGDVRDLPSHVPRAPP